MDQRETAQLVEQTHQTCKRVQLEVAKIIVGQDDVVEKVLITLLAGGHSIITGLPGLAKTLLIQTLAQTIGLKFHRIQFTPDLMPADITGTDILEEDHQTGQRRMRFVSGPVFANLLLADEINRTPPKTQAALLEAMQERHVTVRGQTYPLEPPFFVLATQNPIELEGTYPLPEAQLDRFMFNILIGYPSESEEIDVVKNTTALPQDAPQQILTREELLRIQELVRLVPVADDVVSYAVQLVRKTRPDPSAPEFVNRWVNYGASPRAAQFLILGGKARALLRGRYNVAIEDVRVLAASVMRHRILLNFHAESEQISTDQVVEKLLQNVREMKSGLA
ncbi:MAG: MoxR family ATPase [Acidobacteria bacterium]|nr:MoxR family ATPase [Acidobacteriota bacterium]